MNINYDNPVLAALLGVAVADALGVPVEFKSRKHLDENPVTTMMGYGTYNQPPGTWSDDSSLTFCLAESLCNGYDLNDIALKLTNWVYADSWRPHGRVFDIGNQTRSALMQVKRILNLEMYEDLRLLKYNDDERTNGNGSLMRIIPLLFYIKGMPIKEQFDIIWDVSSLTHPHIRSAIACLFYLRVAEYILNGEDKRKAYEFTQKDIREFFDKHGISKTEQRAFERIVNTDISKVKRKNIQSAGYVMHSIEASMWCLLNTDSYEKAVLTAVNLGEDTDTTAAITGGLAGLYYGTKSISEWWFTALPKLEAIVDLAEKLNDAYVGGK